MTVEEFIRSHLDFTNPGINYEVSATVSGKKYYTGDGTIQYMWPEVRKMRLHRWTILDKGKKFVIIVEQDVEFELAREQERRAMLGLPPLQVSVLDTNN